MVSGGLERGGELTKLSAWPKLRTMACVALAYCAESIDNQLLSAMYLALSRSLGVHVQQLGVLNTARGLAQAFMSPVSGLLGNAFHRGALLAVGTLLWAAFSAGFGLSQTYIQAVAIAACTGIGMAFVSPNAQSLIADLYPAAARGKSFGGTLMIVCLGGMAGSFFAISISNRRFGDLEGWRLAYFVGAALGAATCALVVLGVAEPRRPSGAGHRQALRQGTRTLLRDVWAVLRVRSFCIVLVEHIIGYVQYSSGFTTMYLQLLGFGDIATASITTCSTAGAAVGFFVGGLLGDALSKYRPHAARPAVNQLSIVLGLPLIAVFYKGLPGSTAHQATGVPGSLDHLAWQYALVNFCMALLGVCTLANNAAIISQVVPVKLRASAYAFDGCISGAFGAAAAPLVGLIAAAGGFSQRVAQAHRAAHAGSGAGGGAALAAENVRNAAALEKGLLLIMLTPMLVKLLVYSGLYLTLPVDLLPEEPLDDELETVSSKGSAAPLRSLGDSAVDFSGAEAGTGKAIGVSSEKHRGKGEIALDGALLRRRSGQLGSPPLLPAGPPGVEAKFVALDSLRRRRSGQLGSPPKTSPPRSAMAYGTGYPPPAGAPDKPEQAYEGSQRRRLGQAGDPPLPARHGEGSPPAP